MSLLPYAFARPLLFAMDAEAAHDHTMDWLARSQNTPLQWSYCQSRVDDPVNLAGLQLPNRVGLAAGLDKNARCIDALAAMGFGFVEVGTVTPLGQPGNPKPRMFRLPQSQALINRLGFNNEGLAAFINNVQRARCRQSGAHSSMVLGLNIGKNGSTPMERAVDDYLTCLDGVYPHADYVTVNISSPNTKNLRSLQSDEALEGLIGHLTERSALLAQRHGKAIPLFIKIAPDLDSDQVAVIAATLLRHSGGGKTATWGVIACNTSIDRQPVQGQMHANETGGLSGQPVFDKSNAVIGQLRAQLGPGFPIMGVGGILSGADAVAKVKAGADVVQIYTGLIYRGPGLITEVAKALQARGR
jgi:dihydroorotate dehydrogenase